ncbi:MAG: hypothetical protein HMLKMBBP_01405 [Planctomycetes bacterium]|nr:hypothetical protein [Planctomycetota bacterium]
MDPRPAERTGPSARVAAAAVAVVAVFAHVWSLGGGFLNWDDNEYVTGNAELRLPAGDAAARIATTHLIGNWNPLQRWTYLAEWKLFGDAPLAFRATNLALHAACAVLAFLVLDAWLRGKLRTPAGARWTALIGAAAFAAHPANVENVSWISERKSLLAALFGLASAWAWLRADGRTGLRAASLALFGVGMLGKTSIVVLPALLVLLDLSRSRRPAWVWMCGFAAVAAGPAWMQISAARSAIQPLHGGSPAAHAATVLGVLPGYAAQIVLPVGLAPRHLVDPVTSGADMRPWAGLALLAACVVATVRSFRGARVAMVAIPWTIAVLLVTLVVPIPILRADRYLYLALPFAAAAVAACAVGAADRRGSGVTARFVGVAAVVVVALGAASASYARVWRSSVDLWLHQLSKHPTDARAWFSLGSAYGEAGRNAECRAAYGEVLRLDPQRREPFTRHAIDGIAWLDLAEGRAADVERGAAARVAADPSDAPAWLLLAGAQETQGRIESAAMTWIAASAACPGDPEIAANAAAFTERRRK